MEYALKSDDEFLILYRKYQPMTREAKDYVRRASALPLAQIIAAHYEVNPFIPAVAELPKKVECSLKFKVDGVEENVTYDHLPVEVRAFCSC